MVATVLSLILAALSVIGTTSMAWYQIHRGQEFETEKLKLDLFADFLSICIKKSGCDLSENEKILFYKSYVKLVLIVDKELSKAAHDLYEIASKEPTSEAAISQIQNVKKLMQEQLELFNKKYHRFR